MSTVSDLFYNEDGSKKEHVEIELLKMDDNGKLDWNYSPNYEYLGKGWLWGINTAFRENLLLGRILEKLDKEQIEKLTVKNLLYVESLCIRDVHKDRNNYKSSNDQLQRVINTIANQKNLKALNILGFEPKEYVQKKAKRINQKHDLRGHTYTSDPEPEYDWQPDINYRNFVNSIKENEHLKFLNFFGNSKKPYIFTMLKESNIENIIYVDHTLPYKVTDLLDNENLRRCVISAVNEKKQLYLSNKDIKDFFDKAIHHKNLIQTYLYVNENNNADVLKDVANLLRNNYSIEHIELFRPHEDVELSSDVILAMDQIKNTIKQNQNVLEDIESGIYSNAYSDDENFLSKLNEVLPVLFKRLDTADETDIIESLEALDFHPAKTLECHTSPTEFLKNLALYVPGFDQYGLSYEIPKKYQEQLIEIIQQKSTVALRPDGEKPYKDRITEALMYSDMTIKSYDSAIQEIIFDLEKLVNKYNSSLKTKDGLDHEKERTTLQNEKTEHQIKQHQKAIAFDEARFNNEFTAYGVANTALGAVRAFIAIKTIGMSEIIRAAGESFFDGLPRTISYKTAQITKRNFEQMAIENLRGSIIDPAIFDEKKEEIIQELMNIELAQDIKKNAFVVKSLQRLEKGIFHQRIIRSGEFVGSEVEDLLATTEFNTIDEWFDAFEKEASNKNAKLNSEKAQKLSSAIKNLCHGLADSNDLMMITSAHDFFLKNWKNDPVSFSLQEHERVLVQLVDKQIKENINRYHFRASLIDTALDFGIIDENNRSLDNIVNASIKSEISGIVENEKEMARKGFIIAILKGALTSEFDSARSGVYDHRRTFKYKYGRHGNFSLNGGELQDEGIHVNFKESSDKEIPNLTKKYFQKFDEAVKNKYTHLDNDLIKMNDLFYDLCAHEYFQKQNVNATTVESSFKKSPEVPPFYAVIREVIDTFIQKSTNQSVADFKNNKFEHLESIMVDTFFDYFSMLGAEHNTDMRKERENLKQTFKDNLYASRYTTYQRKIKDDALSDENYDKFLQSYQKNLQYALFDANNVEKYEIQEELKKQNILKGTGYESILEPGSQEALDYAFSHEFRTEFMPEAFFKNYE